MTKTIVITGATDGIGLALARQYYAAGAQLFLVGRRDLAELTSEPFFTPTTYCQVDLADPDCASAVSAFLQAQAAPPIDELILNAGLGYTGPLPDQPPAALAELLAVNVRAPLALTHALAGGQLAPAAHIVFISSVVVGWPAPNYAAYAASKAALDGFVRSLQLEWQDRPVTIQLIHPGATRTGMHAKSGLDLSQMKPDRFMPAEEAARRIRRLIEQGRPEASLGFLNTLIYRSGRWLQPLLEARPNPRATHPPGRCLITGFGAGIGQALAQQYSQAGYAIVGVDNDGAAAAATADAIRAAGGRCQVIVADLSQTVGCQAVLDDLAGDEPLAVVIQNAGISAFGHFEKMAWSGQEKVLALNLLAPLWLTAGLLAAELIRPDANLLFLSSLSHHTGYPGASVYAATKDGVAHFARSLGAAGWRTLTIFPGPTRTEHARRYSPDNSQEGRRMLPATLAAHIWRAQQRRARRLIPGVSNKVLALIGRLAPRLMGAMMRRLLYEKIDV